MTPTTPLDEKVIVRKSHFAELCAMLNPLNQEQNRVANKAMRLLSQNNTGWVAVPKMVTGRMLNAIKESERLNLEQYVTCSDSMAKQLAYSAMLAASPPLPGGGE